MAGHRDKIPPPYAPFFTDGSCYHNEYRHFAVAGAAVVVYAEEKQETPNYIQRFILPTPDHTSFRADFFATYLAVQICSKPTIYTDCQAVIDEWQNILRSFHNGKKPIPLDHVDLWTPIIECVKDTYQHVTLIKVQAHTNNTDWKSRANARAAESEDKQAVTVDHTDTFQVLNQHVQTYLQKRFVEYQVMIFQVQAAVFEFNVRKQAVEIHSQEVREQAQQMAVPTEPQIQIHNDITVAQCSRCKYKPYFLFRLAQWANTFTWEQKSPSHHVVL